MMKKIAYAGLSMLMVVLFILACGKDDGPTPTPEEQNTPPAIEDQTLSVAENKQPGDIKLINADDEDEDTLTFSLSGDSPFVISTSGILSLAEGQSLDYEDIKEYVLTVTVKDEIASANAKLTIMVTNVDEPPTFSEESFQFGVSEDQNTTDAFGTVGASDPEGDELNFEITENPNDLFIIDANGQLRVAQGKILNFEAFNGEDPTYHLTVTVTDSQGLASTIAVNVTLINKEEFPYFNDESYDVTVNEDMPQTETVTTVAATDPDGGTVTYSIVVNDNGLFTINTVTGTIFLDNGKTLDFEAFNGADPIHHITVQARDLSGNMAQIDIAITVTDVDEDPTFGEANYEFDVAENSTQIGSVMATDPQDDIIDFGLTGGPDGLFTIDENGTINIAEGQVLNFEEETNAYELTVTATDPMGNIAQATVTITVTDVDEAPELTSSTTINVNENVPDYEVFALLMANDPEGEEVLFTLIDDADGIFEMTAEGALGLTDGQNLDFEQEPNTYELTVRLSDGTITKDYVLNMQVQNVNEVPEVAAQFNFEALESINHVINLGIIEAQDPDGDNLSFEVLGNNTLFEIDANGNLSLIEGQNLDFEGFPNHQITVQVTDGELTTDTQVNIAVTNSFADLNTPFISTWRTTTSNEEVRIGVRAEYAYNFSIDWGDGNIEDFDFNNREFISHIYDTPGDYAVAILGDFPALYSQPGLSLFPKLKLIGIEQWGDNLWQTMEYAFYECRNLAYYNVEEGDTPNLTIVTSLRLMFAQTYSFDGDLTGWDVMNVEDMTGTFFGATSFQGIGLETWNPQNVTTMASLFRDCESFDKNLGDWNILNVNTLSSMFNNSGMSTENYSATLIGWASQMTPPQNVAFLNQNGMQYCNQAVQARLDLEALGWQISGDSATNQDCLP